VRAANGRRTAKLSKKIRAAMPSEMTRCTIVARSCLWSPTCR